MLIVLDPGHGYGKAHNRGGVLFNEGDQNYKFAKVLKGELLKYENVTVKMTRNSIYENPTLSQRAKVGIGADIFLSTHTNAFDSSVSGIEVFGAIKNSTKGKDLGTIISKKGAEILSIPNRGYKVRKNGTADYWGVFRWGNTAKEKYLIEWCFHTNRKDSEKYLANQEKLAIMTAQEIAKKYGLTRKNYGIKTESPQTDVMHRIQVGAFGNYANAEKYLKKLAEAGFNGIIKTEKK